MKPIYILFFLVFFLLFGGINYYIGLRGWQAFSGFIPFLTSKLYWVFFWTISLCYFVARIGEKFLPSFIINATTIVGSYWLAAMFYLVILLGIADIIRLIYRWLNKATIYTRGYPRNNSTVNLLIIIVVIVILIYGTWNAQNPKVSYYKISTPKSAGELKSLHIAMVSDIHLGNIMDNDRLNIMVNRINNMNPDIVLLAGDVIDDRVGPFVKQKMSETFRKLNPQYGVFASLGNHEYIGGEVNDAVFNLNQAGIKVLRDSYIKIGNYFYIAGREDLASERFLGVQRKKLSEVLSGVDRSLPIILLDHQPVGLDESEKEGIDLQLSGHTHKGQMFPNQFITRKVFEIDWGHLQKKNLNAIVSSGFGTWGPPIRIGSRSEIVDIVLDFGE
jgi:uncharacterized protein